MLSKAYIFDTMLDMKINAKTNAASSQLVRGTDAWLEVIEAYNLCIQLLADRLAKVNVSVAEHDVLMALLHNSGAAQQQIAKVCFVAKSGVSMLLTKLEISGLVRREADATDARIKRVYLTTKGEKLARKTLAVQQDIVDLMARPMSDNDLNTVAKLMQGVSTRLKQAK
jgi:DNA-binding MarR family transcriptional regulator